MKLQILIQDGTLAGQQFELSEGFLTIGRGGKWNINFDAFNEKIVSSKHAYIEKKGGDFFIVDSQSTNGTFVNGYRAQFAKLSSGDVLQFGKNGPTAKILIESGQTINIAPANFSQTPQPSVQTLDAIASQNPIQMPPVYPQHPQQYANTPLILPPIDNANAGGAVLNSSSQIGLGGAEGVSAAPKRNFLGLAIAVFGIVFLSLIVILIVVLDLGIAVAVIASLVAFIPAVFYLLPMVWLDRYDPEPAWLLAFAFAWGALIAVIFSIVINTLMSGIFGSTFGSVISAPVFEEASKGLGLLVLLIFFRREFDDVLDGVIFAGFIALGFATVENVLYYGRGFLQSGYEGLLVTFFLRGVLSPFAHVTFTAMTGIGFGIARESHNTAIKFLAPIIGYVFAVILHALWNGMAVFGGGQVFLLGYLLLEIPFFLIFVGFCFYVMRRQNKILKEMLAMDTARGLITDEQLKTLTSAFKSTGWLLSGLFAGKYKARSRFLRNVGKLGLSYWHIQRATNSQAQTASFQANPIFREEVIKWRDKI